MTGAVMQISSKNFVKSSFRISTKNAWAKYARSRWPKNALFHMNEEWGLTEGEARGVLYAQASQATIDKILDHRNGGPMLALAIWELRFEVTLEQYIEQQAENARHERAKFEAREQYLARLQSRVSDDSRLERVDA